MNINKPENFVEGLVLPAGSIYNREMKINSTNFAYDILVGSDYEIFWSDVVHVANLERYDCSKMFTTGKIALVHSDFLVIANPITIRTYPEPIKNHPNYTPFYYVIPKSFITKINQIN